MLFSQTGTASKPLKAQMTALNEVKFSISTTNAPSETSRKFGDAVGYLRDEDNTKEHETALSIPMKDKDFQNQLQSVLFIFSNFF